MTNASITWKLIEYKMESVPGTENCFSGPEFVMANGKSYKFRREIWNYFSEEELEKGIAIYSSCGTKACCQFDHMTLEHPQKKPKARKEETPEQREKRLAYGKRYQQENKERIREARKVVYWADPEAARAKVREYKRLHPEKAKYAHQVLSSEKSEEIKERRAARNRDRKAKIQGLPSEVVALREVGNACGWICQLCFEGKQEGCKWSVDHILPVSLGGANVRENLQLAHLCCNSRKGNRV